MIEAGQKLFLHYLGEDGKPKGTTLYVTCTGIEPAEGGRTRVNLVNDRTGQTDYEFQPSDTCFLFPRQG